MNFNERSVGACRKISSGTVSDCDKKRTDNFDFWSHHRGEGRIYDGSATVSMVDAPGSFATVYGLRTPGSGFRLPDKRHYTFVPFKSLLFRSPYGGSYSTALAPESFMKRVNMRRITLPYPNPGAAGAITTTALTQSTLETK